MSSTVPVITQVTYTPPPGSGAGIAVTATVDPGKTLVAELLANGTAIGTAIGAGSQSATIPLTSALYPGIQYSVQAQWSGSSTWSAPVPVICTTPSIVSQDYDGATLVIKVDTPEPAAAYSATIPVGTSSQYIQATSEIAAIPASGLTSPCNMTLSSFIPLDNTGVDFSTGPSVSWVVPTALPTVTTISYDRSTLSVFYTSPSFQISATSPEATVSTVVASGLVRISSGTASSTGSTIAVFEGDSSGASVVLSLPPDATAAVSVRGIAPGASGPWTATVDTITTPPTAVSAECSSDGTSLILSWTAPVTVSGVATGYDIVFSAPGQADILLTETASPATILFSAITAVLDNPAAPVSVRVRATGSATYMAGTVSNAVALTGPWSEEIFILQSPVTNLSATTRDGNLVVDWVGTPGPVAGYLVELLNGTTPVNSVTVAAAPAIVSPGTFSASASYNVSVTPVCGASKGLTTSASVQLGTFTFGTIFAGGTSSATYLFPPACSTTCPTSGNLTITVPDVVGPGVTAAGTCTLPTIASGDTQTTFSLAWQADSNLSGAFEVVVTVVGSDVYVDTATGRTTLLQSFDTFRHQLDNLTGTGATASLTPHGAQIIADRVARSLPLRTTEILQYFHAFNRQYRYADLKAGMRLRIEPGISAIAQNSAAVLSNSLMSTGTLLWTLLPQANGSLCIDGFIGQIAAVQYTADPEGSGYQVLGLADFAAENWEFTYWRLIWPSQWLGDSPASPNLGVSIALIGANSLDDLSVATTNYTQNGASATNAVTCFFTGRATIVPEIPIVIDDRPVYVSLGTTIRQVAAHRVLTPAGQFGGAIGSTIMDCYSVALRRWTQSTYESGVCPFRLTEVLFTPPVSGPANPQWDMPLLAGDVLTFG